MKGVTTHVVVGVENPGDVLGQVPVQHSLDVSAHVNCGRSGSGVKARFFPEEAEAEAEQTALTVLEVEVAGGLGRPQPHGVDDVVSVPGHRRVVRKGQHHLDRSQSGHTCSGRRLAGKNSRDRPNLRVHPLHAIVRVLHAAVEVDRAHVLRPSLLPGVAVPQPVVGFLHLWKTGACGSRLLPEGREE